MIDELNAPPAAGEDALAATEEEMVRAMRRYRALKRRLEAETARANEYLEQVKAEIERDLKPLEEEIERNRASMRAFVTECNAGKKFKVPGLGVAYTQSRLSVKITDEEELVRYLGAPEVAELYDLKFNAARAKRRVEASYKEDGEMLPGTEVEAEEILAVKLA